MSSSLSFGDKLTGGLYPEGDVWVLDRSHALIHAAHIVFHTMNMEHGSVTHTSWHAGPDHGAHTIAYISPSQLSEAMDACVAFVMICAMEVHVCMYMYMHIYVCNMYICVCMYACMYVLCLYALCMYVCMHRMYVFL